MSRVVTRRPPVKGWDTSRSLADMDAETAILMDNWVTDGRRLVLRRGSVEHAAGMGAAVDSLLSHAAPDGGRALFACAGGAIYDVSGSGAVGAAVVSGLSGDRWQGAHMVNTGGSHLVAVNGADEPRRFDGATWDIAAITGPVSTDLVWISAHQARLWMGEKDSLSAWYLPAQAIQGAATKFDVGAFARLGGHLVGMGSWTRDSGAGPDDVAVFLTSEGEALVYAGTDPASAATWGLVGIYSVGRPLGRRCMVRVGGDLVFMTEEGFVSLSAIMTGGQREARARAVSRRIDTSLRDAVRLSRERFGWDAAHHTASGLVLFNIPQSNGRFHQYVFDSVTQAASRFTGWDGRCWAVMDGRLFFGTTDGRVIEADTGTTDQGGVIKGDLIPAYAYFRTPSRDKAFLEIEPIYQAAADPQAAIDIGVDFAMPVAASPPQVTTTEAGIWDEAIFDESTFGTPDAIFDGWRGISGFGRAATCRLRNDCAEFQPALVAINWRVEDAA